MKSTMSKNNNDILLREKSITLEDTDQISFSDYIKEKRKLEASPSVSMSVTAHTEVVKTITAKTMETQTFQSARHIK